MKEKIKHTLHAMKHTLNELIIGIAFAWFGLFFLWILFASTLSLLERLGFILFLFAFYKIIRTLDEVKKDKTK